MVLKGNSQTDSKGIFEPKISFERTTYDYGTIIASESKEDIIFKFKNEGNMPLIIDDIISSCGCVVVKWSKEPIMQNEEGKIRVRYNTNIIGEIKRSITVMTNDKKNPRIVLLLTGKIK